MAIQTRREFLENSMFAAAAAVAGSVPLTRPLQAAEASNSPSEVLRVAILGVNGRGKSHIDGFKRLPGCEIVAICDPDEKVGYTKGVDLIEKETGKRPAFYQDLRRVMDDPSINIVTIATPNHWHSLASIWAMQAGKDVYVEKPISHNVSEGRRVVEAARKYKRICQAGTQCRSMGGSIAAIEYIKAGKIGEVNLARGLCYKGRGSIGPRGVYQVPTEVDYNLWAGPAPMSQLTRPKFHYDWHWQWDFGNGDLGNQGIHQMDVARWGLGVSDLGKRVLSYGGRLGYTDAGDTANTQVSIHDYGDKLLVFEVRGLPTDPLKQSSSKLIESGVRPPKPDPEKKDAKKEPGDPHQADVGVIFYGTKGYVVLSSYTAGAAFDLDGNMLQAFNEGGDHFENFTGAVRSRNPAELHGEILEGHLSSGLCHLGNISYRLGEEVSLNEAKERLQNVAAKQEALDTFERFTKHLEANHVAPADAKIQFGRDLILDPQTEQFVGPQAPMANSMLTREYRAPFVVPAAGAV